MALGLTGSKRTAAAPVSFVAMEYGARLPDSRLPFDGHDTAILMKQLDGERPAEFMRRSAARIGRIERSGRRVASARIIVAANHDVESMAARHLLAQALLVHARAANEGPFELTLVTGGRVDWHLRQDLMTLVDDLLLAAGSSTSRIRVQFGPIERAVA